MHRKTSTILSWILPPASTAVRTDREWLEPHWMPYCANRAFKADPHLFVAGEGAWLTTSDGRRLYDSLSGLWCTGLGHCRTGNRRGPGRTRPALRLGRRNRRVRVNGIPTCVLAHRHDVTAR